MKTKFIYKTFVIFLFIGNSAVEEVNDTHNLSDFDTSVEQDEYKDTLKTSASAINSSKNIEIEGYHNQREYLQGRCNVPTYGDILLDIIGNSSKSYSLMSFAKDYHNFSIGQSEKYTKKIQCFPKNISANESSFGKVILINSTFLLNKLNSLKNDSASSNYCAIVMFYAPWCHFCAKAAPHYNALARVFPHIDVYALDAIAHNNLNFRFGTVAVPNIIIFHNSKAVARYNHTERTLQKFTSFVANVTGLSPNTTEILPIDYEGPLKPDPSEARDYFLWMSWIVVVIVTTIYFSKSSMAHSIWNIFANHMGHIEHAHID